MFWFSLLMFVIMLGAVVTAMVSRERGVASLIAVVAGVVGAVSLVASMMSQVPTRNVGIVTQFNKPTGRTTGSGLQWTSPLQNVEDWDATTKAFAATGDGHLTVKIAGGGTAYVDVTVLWRAAVPRSPENFAAFRAEGKDSRFEVFTNRRVNQPIAATIQSLFTSFDPFEGVAAAKIGAGGLPPSPDLNGLYAQKLIDRLNLAIGGGTLGADGKTVDVQKDDPATRNEFEDDPDADVVIQQVTFGGISYDKDTNDKLAGFGQKLLEGRNLEVDKANAETRKAIAGQSGLTPFQAACLAQAGAYAGLCAGGGGSQVILPAK